MIWCENEGVVDCLRQLMKERIINAFSQSDGLISLEGLAIRSQEERDRLRVRVHRTQAAVERNQVSLRFASRKTNFLICEKSSTGSCFRLGLRAHWLTSLYRPASVICLVFFHLYSHIFGVTFMYNCQLVPHRGGEQRFFRLIAWFGLVFPLSFIIIMVPAAAVINFRFKNAKETDIQTYSFSGTSASLKELKDFISTKHKLNERSTRPDKSQAPSELSVENAETGQGMFRCCAFLRTNSNKLYMRDTGKVETWI